MSEKKISKAVISRLPRYYRYLAELLEEGTDRISSNELAKRMHVTASQIRQDLNNFGGFGQQGYGYNVKTLYSEIGKLLGVDIQHNVIIIGAGHLGQALANYPNFPKRGFVVRALFDVDPAVIGLKINGAPVYHIDELEQYLSEHETQVVTLTIPKGEALGLAKRLAKTNIRAIWNFAHTDLPVPERIVVENVHLSESLMRLSYRFTSEDGKVRRGDRAAEKEGSAEK